MPETSQGLIRTRPDDSQHHYTGVGPLCPGDGLDKGTRAVRSQGITCGNMPPLRDMRHVAAFHPSSRPCRQKGLRNPDAKR